METKNRITVGLSLSKEIYEKLKAYSQETGIPQSRVVDKALAKYLEEQQ